MSLNRLIPHRQLPKRKFTREWPKLQRELAEISSNSEFWVAHDSGHSIPVEQPEIIVKAISKLIGKARSAIKATKPTVTAALLSNDL